MTLDQIKPGKPFRLIMKLGHDVDCIADYCRTMRVRREKASVFVECALVRVSISIGGLITGSWPCGGSILWMNEGMRINT